MLCVTDDEGLIGCPSITDDRLRLGLSSGQQIRLQTLAVFLDVHVRFPSVNITRNVVFDAVAAWQSLRSGIAADLSIMAGDTCNGRAFPLSFDRSFVHICARVR